MLAVADRSRIQAAEVRSLRAMVERTKRNWDGNENIRQRIRASLICRKQNRTQLH